MNPSQDKALNLDDLPWEIKANIFNKIDSRHQQLLREVSTSWRDVIGRCFGIHVVASNLNWEWIEDSQDVVSALVIGLTRDILNPCNLACHLRTLEFTDMTAYYSIFHLLEKCTNLRNLILKNIMLLPRSKLPEFLKPEYLDGSNRKWLPRLKRFVFSTHTPLVIADEVEQMDIGRRRKDEADFLPTFFQMLKHSPLKHLDLTLGDMWKVQFKEFFGNLTELLDENGNQQASSNDLALFTSNWLPVKTLGKARESLRSCRMYYPFRDDEFFMIFHPEKSNGPNEIPQLEEAVVQQFFKWGSTEGETLDTMWLQILDHQFNLKRLTYAFPITGNDARMQTILIRNKNTLENVIFSGYRDVRDEQLNAMVGLEPRPWDALWFNQCQQLTELTFNPLSRILFPLSFITFINPHLLPNSLRTLKIIGTIDTGNKTLEEGFKSLENLEVLELRVRKYPWFLVKGHGYSEFDLTLFQKLHKCMPKLKNLKLVWSEDVVIPGIIGPFVLPGGEIASKTEVSGYLLAWLKSSVGVEVMELRVSDSSYYLKDYGLDINILDGFQRNTKVLEVATVWEMPDNLGEII